MIRPEKPFDIQILAEKTVSISVKTFFFLEITCFWAEKPFEFPILAEKSVSISDKPCDSDSRTMKVRSRSLAVVSLFQKSPPPFFKSWLRACNQLDVMASLYLKHIRRHSDVLFKPHQISIFACVIESLCKAL